jgi:hypothetical protein
VTRGVDEVDQKLAALGVLGHVLVGEILRRHVVVQRNSGRLDGDTALGLVSAGIGKTGVTGVRHGNNTGSSDQRVGKSGLAVVNVRNNGHIPNVLRFVHNST